jgi:uncharacterized protein YbbC (DUF1343 family)
VIKILFVIILITISTACESDGKRNYENQNVVFSSEGFKLGNEVLLTEKLDMIKGKNVALLTNSTGITGGGKHLLDMLAEKGVNVVKIFTPEHGFDSDDTYNDKNIKIPVISLYGNNKSFPSGSLNGIDVIIYDIQDVGARFYTYTSTMYLTLKDAIRQEKKFVVCDRPSVANLNYTGGFMLDERFSSFVGMIPAPVVYGMTCGELAAYLAYKISEETSNPLLEVIKMKGYTRKTDYVGLNLPWINTSPNITSLESARLYPALCFLEGTNMSEGRGTDTPFRYAGAPFVDGEALAGELNSYNLPGIKFTAVEFTPDKVISAYPPKFLNKKCSGVKLTLTDINSFLPSETSVAVLCALKKVCPEFRWTENNFIDKLAGTDKLRKMVNKGSAWDEISAAWSSELSDFNSSREKFFLY